MQTKIVAIGNSMGVRLPKHVLREAQLDLARPVRLTTRVRAIVIEQTADPRANWEASFRSKRPRKPENPWGEVPLDEGWDR